jgi:hypothetical protein
MSGTRAHRSTDGADKVVALSLSSQRDHLLARGLGGEHLSELLARLARPLLRRGTNLVYGGNWKTAGLDARNFTSELLDLVAAEQEHSSDDVLDTASAVGKLFNPLAWPGYLDVTPGIEARWINCCRIIRVTQQDAGIREEDTVPDAEARGDSDRALFNAAITISRMRRLMSEPMVVNVPSVPEPERVLQAAARIALGGKVEDYSGFAPGVFEEALLTGERGQPLYLLGGFGGACEVLARAILDRTGPRPPEVTIDWQRAHNPRLARLQALVMKYEVPAGARSTSSLFYALGDFIERARADPAGTLATGLDADRTRELMKTSDVNQAVRLVRAGLQARGLIAAADA